MNAIRAVSGFLAVTYGANAAAMIAAPQYWYLTTPGLTETGPFNAHFVIDIGFAYLMSAAGFGLWALRPVIGSGVAVMASVWPALHGLFHVVHWSEGLPAGLALWTELLGVIGAAIAGLFVAWRARAVEGRA